MQLSQKRRDAVSPSAELIVRNARISTLDPQRPQAGALAVAGGKLLAVGEEAEVMRHAGPGTRVIDAARRRLIPGLIDSHLHLSLIHI